MSANSSIGSAKTAKFAIKVAADEAAVLAREKGTAAVEDAGVAAARARLLAASIGDTGRGAAKNAKREAEEREVWVKSVLAPYENAVRAHNIHPDLEQAFVERGFKLPYRPRPAHPGCPPAPFVSSAEKHRLENERRAAANKARMAAYTPSSNSSCSPPVSSGGAGGLLVLQRIKEREEAAAIAATRTAAKHRCAKLRGFLYRLLRWVRSIRTRNSSDSPLDLLKLSAWNMSRDAELSVTQKRKWSNVLRFCEQLPTRCDLSLIGYKGPVSATVTSDTLHVSNLPGPFNHREMEKVLKQLRAIISKAAPHMLRRGQNGHQIMRNKIAMRDDWSSGFGIFQVGSPELAAAMVGDLQESGSTVTADCFNMDKKGRPVHFGMRTAVVKFQLATTTTQRTKQEQREYEEAIKEERRRLFHEGKKAEREAKLAVAAAKQEFKDSFVALPGAPVSAPVAPVVVGPSFRELLQGLARPAPVVHVAPVDAPVGWHEGEVYDVLSPREMLARFQGFTAPADETPVLITRLNVATGWEEEFTLEQVQAAAAAEEAAEAAKAAAIKAAKTKAAKTKATKTKATKTKAPKTKRPDFGVRNNRIIAPIIVGGLLPFGCHFGIGLSGCTGLTQGGKAGRRQKPGQGPYGGAAHHGSGIVEAGHG
jgi:hypothetical protein